MNSDLNNYINDLENDEIQSPTISENYRLFNDEKLSNFGNPSTISDKSKERQNIQIEIRNYQYKLFQQSKEDNSIVVLETGTGKTMIAIYLIYHHLSHHNLEKKIAFITNTVQLCEQQYDQIIQKMPLVAEILKEEVQKIDLNLVKFEILHGDKYVDMWSGGKWKEVIVESNVFCMTSQVFLNCLRRGYLKFYEFSLLVLDECHHANKDHPYNNIMKEFYFYYKDLNDPKLMIPQIFGLTASPFLTMNNNKKQEKFDIKDIEENLILLCKNLDSNFSGYDPLEVKMFLKEANSLVKVFTNDKYIQNCNGEKFLRYIEDYNTENGSFWIILQQERSIAKFYKDFNDKILEVIKQNNGVSKVFRDFVEEIDKYLKKKTLRILHELGMVGLSFFIEDLLKSLEDLEKQTMIGGTNEYDKNGYKLLKNMFSQYYSFLLNKLKIREEIEGKNSMKLEKLIEIIKEKEKLEDNQTTILIFVSKRMIAKYMNNILQLYFEKRVGYIVGQSKMSEKNKENSVLFEKKLSEYPKMSEIRDFFQLNINSLNENLLKDQKKMQLKSYFNDKYTLKQQLNVIREFKEKTIDFLISTSVTEEGFDVPNCNLVVAYNDVQTIRSFIQLKGRARKENSEFLLFSPEILAESTQNKKDDYEKLCKKMKEVINKLAEKPKNVVINTELSLKVRQSTRFYEVTIIENSGAFLNSNWAKDLLQNYISFLKKSDRIKNKCLEYFLNMSTKTSPNSYICLILLPPNAQKQLFFFDSYSFSSKEEAKKASYYKAVLELYKGGCFTKNLKPCSVDLMRINLDNEEDDNVEKDFLYKDLMKKHVKSISSRVNEAEKPRIINYYPRMNQEVFQYSYMKEKIFYKANEWNFCLYFVEFDDKIDELKENCKDNRLGLIYFSEVLKNFTREICGKSREKIGKIKLKLIKTEFNLKENFERLYKIYQFLEISKKSWTFKYIASLITDKLDQKNNKKHSLKLKKPESSLILVILKEDNSIDWAKYELIETHIKILTDFYSVFPYNNENSQKINELYQKYQINFFSKTEEKTDQLILTDVYSFTNFVIKNIIDSNSEPDFLQNPNIKSINSFIDKMNEPNNFIRVQGLKKSIFFQQKTKENSQIYDKIGNTKDFLIFPLNYSIIQRFFLIIQNIHLIRDFLISLVFKETLQKAEDCKKDKCQIYEEKLEMNYSFWRNEHKNFSEFLERKYPRILKTSHSKYVKIKENFIFVFENSLIDQQFLDKKYEALFQENIASKIKQMEICMKSIDYNTEQNNQIYLEIGSSILNFLVSVTIFFKKKRNNYRNYAELCSERARYTNNTFLHRIVVRNQFYQFLLNKAFRVQLQTILETKETESSYLPSHYIEANIKQQADFLKALIGIYYDSCDKDILACQKFLWQIEILENPSYKVLQTEKLVLEEEALILKHFKPLLNHYKFKNHGLLIQAFSTRIFKKKVDEFYLEREGLKEEMSFLIDLMEEDRNDHSLKLENVKMAEKILNSISPNDFLNERLSFLGEGLMNYLIIDYLRENFAEKDIKKMQIQKKLLCNRYFYLWIAIYLDIHKFIPDEKLNNYKFLRGVEDNFDEYLKNYQAYLELFFKMGNKPNQQVIDCLMAFFGAILVDCNFVIDFTIREITNLVRPLIESVMKEEILLKNPWFLYEEILVKNGIKEIGYKKSTNYKNELIFSFCFEIKKSNEDRSQNGLKDMHLDIIGSNEEEAREILIPQILEKFS